MYDAVAAPEGGAGGTSPPNTNFLKAELFFATGFY